MRDATIRRLTEHFGIGSGVLTSATVPPNFVYPGAPPASNVYARGLLKMLAAAGYAILRTCALPRGTAVTALIVAAVGVALVPSLHFGTDAAAFSGAVGWGDSALAAALVTAWGRAVGIAALTRARPVDADALAA